MKHLAKTQLILLAVALVPLLVAVGCGDIKHGTGAPCHTDKGIFGENSSECREFSMEGPEILRQLEKFDDVEQCVETAFGLSIDLSIESPNCVEIPDGRFQLIIFAAIH